MSRVRPFADRTAARRRLAHARLATATGLVSVTLLLGVVTACSTSTTTGPTVTVTPTAPTTTAAVVDTSAPETTAAPTPTTETVPVETTPARLVWDEIGPPNAPTDHTDVVPTDALVDGFYWANLVGGTAAAPYMTVMQAFFGDECPTAAAEDGEECYGDVYVRATPTLDVDDVPFAADALITVVDPNVMQNYRIDATELDVLRTQGASDSAPEGFLFVPFPWLVSVQGGEIVAFQQLWVP